MAQQYALPRKTERIELKPPPKPAMPVQAPIPTPMDPAIQKALLATIARGEARGYNALAGNGTFSDFSRHPTPGPSQPAGRYQFLGSTWNEQAKKYGYKDFQPGTQDTAAVNYAREVYKAKTGGNLDEALASNDPTAINLVGQALNKTWTSLPGGPEQNEPWRGRNFADVYSENLKGTNAPLDPTPNVGSGASGYDTSISTASDDTGKKDEKKKKRTTEEKIGDAAGEGLENIGKAYAAGAKNTLPSSPATVAPPMLPLPQGPQPMVDPKMVEMQRQQLALAMRRLNSGRLV
jgi:muramidase (phage lysozyme)